MRHQILKYTQHLRHRYLFLSFNIIKGSAPPLFWLFCAPGLVNQLGTSFFFPICFLDDSRPHLDSRFDVHGDNIAFNAHQCPPMPTNAHPMPTKIALQCPSNALNNVIPYRTYFVQGKGRERRREGETSGREGTRANLHRMRRHGAGGTWGGRKLTYSPHCTVGGISSFLPLGTLNARHRPDSLPHSQSLPLSSSPLPPSCSRPHSLLPSHSFQKMCERTRHKILKHPLPPSFPPSPYMYRRCAP